MWPPTRGTRPPLYLSSRSRPRAPVSSHRLPLCSGPLPCAARCNDVAIPRVPDWRLPLPVSQPEGTARARRLLRQLYARLHATRQPAAVALRNGHRGRQPRKQPSPWRARRLMPASASAGMHARSPRHHAEVATPPTPGPHTNPLGPRRPSHEQAARPAVPRSRDSALPVPNSDVPRHILGVIYATPPLNSASGSVPRQDGLLPVRWTSGKSTRFQPQPQAANGPAISPLAEHRRRQQRIVLERRALALQSVTPQHAPPLLVASRAPVATTAQLEQRVVGSALRQPRSLPPPRCAPGPTAPANPRNAFRPRPSAPPPCYGRS
mmetsp:Transcript_4369/g.12613  ORF Transcript_4369/g.12613 Transcript_4369/m.12613 type:complete len:322 (-) Transcript_4369:1003-1968(-)